MAYSDEYVQILQSKKLVQFGENSGFYVPISHSELDGLVGRLMQICDIMGDTTQREAVKSEIKQRTRGWLDGEYSSLGYHNYQLLASAKVATLPLEELKKPPQIDLTQQ